MLQWNHSWEYFSFLIKRFLCFFLLFTVGFHSGSIFLFHPQPGKTQNLSFLDTIIIITITIVIIIIIIIIIIIDVTWTPRPGSTLRSPDLQGNLWRVIMVSNRPPTYLTNSSSSRLPSPLTSRALKMSSACSKAGSRGSPCETALDFFSQCWKYFHLHVIKSGDNLKHLIKLNVSRLISVKQPEKYH